MTPVNILLLYKTIYVQEINLFQKYKYDYQLLVYGIVTLCYILHYLSAVLSLDLGSGQPIIILDDVLLFIAVHFANMVKKVKVDHTRLPGVGLRS